MDVGNPLAGGFLNSIPPNASNQTQIVALNEVINRLNSLLKTQVFSDGTTRRFIQGFSAGRWPGGDFGIAIAEAGKDVLLCDFEDLVFAWDFTTNKQYIRSGTQYWYNEDGLNYAQLGRLPDSTDGIATARRGFNVSDGIS